MLTSTRDASQRARETGPQGHSRQMLIAGLCATHDVTVKRLSDLANAQR